MSYSDQVKAIEARWEEGECYPAEGIRNAVKPLYAKLENLDSNSSECLDLQADINDQEIVITMAECYQAAIDLARSQFLANQLKEDYDHTVGQLTAAIEDSGDEHEVSIDVLGDVILPRFEYKGNLWLDTKTTPAGTAHHTLA